MGLHVHILAEKCKGHPEIQSVVVCGQCVRKRCAFVKCGGGVDVLSVDDTAPPGISETGGFSETAENRGTLTGTFSSQTPDLKGIWTGDMHEA